MEKTSYATRTYGIDVEAIDRTATVTVTVARYSRTDSGKSWRSKPYETATERVDGRYYHSVIDAMPFFRGIGGKERVTVGATCVGYIPVTLTSVSPDGACKIVWSFGFRARR